MTENYANLEEIENQIRAVEENLRTMIEEAAAVSGAADEELASERITMQQEELERLQQLREQMEAS